MSIALSVLVSLVLLALHYGLGGPNLAFALPAYTLLAVPAVLSLLLIRRRSVSPNQWAVASFVAFYGYVALRAWFSPVEYLAAEELLLALACLCVYLLFTVVITNPDHRMIFAVALLVLILPHGVLAAYQTAREAGFNFWDVVSPRLNRPGGMFVNANNTAAFLLIACSFGLSLVFWARWPSAAKVPVAAITLLGIITIALTMSRAGFGGGLIAICVFVLLSFIVYQAFFYWPNYYILIFTLVLFTGGIVLFSLIQNKARIDPIANRIASAAEGLEWRNLSTQMGLKQIQLNPVTGTGAGSYDYEATQFRPAIMLSRPVYAHNDYVELVAEYGLIGGGLLLLLVGTHAYSGFMNFRRLAFHRLQQSGRCSSNALALQMAAIPALLGLAFMIFFSFHTQIPGIALPFVFCLAVLANPGSRDNGQQKPIARRSKGGNQAKSSKGPAPLTLAWRIIIPLLMIWPVVETFRRWPTEYYTYQARTALRAENNPLKTLELLEKALVYDQRNYETWFLLGEARRMLAVNAMSTAIKDFYYRNAIDAYQKSMELYPRFLPHRWFLARIYDYYGRFEESDALWEQLLKDDPEGAYNMAYYALHAQIKGDYELALEYYSKPYVRAVPFATKPTIAAQRALREQRANQAQEQQPPDTEDQRASEEPDAMPGTDPDGEQTQQDPFAPRPASEDGPQQFELELHIQQP